MARSTRRTSFFDALLEVAEEVSDVFAPDTYVIDKDGNIALDNTFTVRVKLTRDQLAELKRMSQSDRWWAARRHERAAQFSATSPLNRW